MSDISRTIVPTSANRLFVDVNVIVREIFYGYDCLNPDQSDSLSAKIRVLPDYPSFLVSRIYYKVFYYMTKYITYQYVIFR